MTNVIWIGLAVYWILGLIFASIGALVEAATVYDATKSQYIEAHGSDVGRDISASLALACGLRSFPLRALIWPWLWWAIVSPLYKNDGED